MEDNNKKTLNVDIVYNLFDELYNKILLLDHFDEFGDGMEKWKCGTYVKQNDVNWCINQIKDKLNSFSK